jgi:hypothetical protein
MHCEDTESGTAIDSSPIHDPAIKLRKEGPFWQPVYVFTHRSGRQTRLDGKEYGELVKYTRRMEVKRQ